MTELALLLQEGSTGDPTAIGIFRFFAGFVLVITIYYLLPWIHVLDRQGRVEVALQHAPAFGCRLSARRFAPCQPISQGSGTRKLKC